MPRARCANPVFVQWLEELRDAEDKDSNRYWTYAKAAKAMKQHPEVLAHPSKAIEIKGIGPKIVQALTTRHIDANGGVDVGGDGTTVVKSSRKSTAGQGSSSSSSSQTKKRAKKQQPPSSSDAEPAPEPAPAPRKVGGVAFVNHTVVAGGLVVVNRTAAAAPAVVPAPAPKRNARQALPRDEDMYENLFANREPVAAVHYPPPVLMPAPPSRPVKAAFPFFYLDENGNHTRSRDIAVKDILQNGLYHKIEYPAHAHSHALVMAGMVIQATAKPERGTFWAFIADEASEEYESSPGFEQQAPAAAAPRAGPSRQPSMSNLAADAALRRISRTHLPSSPAQPVTSSSRTAVPARTQTLSAVPVASSSVSRIDGVAAPLALTQTMPAAAPTAVRAQAAGSKNRRPRLSAQMPIPRFDGDGLRIDASCIGLDGMDALAREFPNFSPLVLPAETYEIVLLLDMREDRAGGDRMLEGLKELRVRCERKTLELGDVLWIARRIHRRGDDYDEIALDFIVERKRMDDLIQSLKDSRYHDQKFRLHGSAMSHIYYVVEGYNAERHMRDYGQQIATVVSSTQVVDGFMVKETSALKDTISYLANLHEAILDFYKNQTIHVIPSAHVKPYSYVALQKHLREIRHPGTPMHVSLPAFQQTQSKRGHVTVSEAWARMLLGVNQMSAAKVAAVRAEYEGPAQLWRAFRAAEAQEAAALQGAGATQKGKGRGRPKIPKAEHMLTTLGGKGREAIGPALSRRIYRVMRASRYDALVDEDSSDED